MAAALTEAQLSAPERECTGCHRVLPVGFFYTRPNRHRPRFTRCRECMGAYQARRHRALVAHHRQQARSNEELARLEDLRDGRGLLRCELPTAPDPRWRGLKHPPCGALVFDTKRREHLVGVHCIAEPTDIQIEQSFAAIAVVDEEEEQHGREEVL